MNDVDDGGVTQTVLRRTGGGAGGRVGWIKRLRTCTGRAQGKRKENTAFRSDGHHLDKDKGTTRHRTLKNKTEENWGEWK